MISWESFMALKAGDIVLFNGKPRTVRELSHNGYITFAILRRSWTNKGYTVYDYNSVKNKLSLPRKQRDRREVCKAEEEQLLSIGFDPEREAKRKLKEELEFEERMRKTGGRCKTIPRDAKALLKQTVRKFERRKK